MKCKTSSNIKWRESLVMSTEKQLKRPVNIEDLEKLIPLLKAIDLQIQRQGFLTSQISSESSVIQKQFEEIVNQKKVYSEQHSMKFETLKKYHYDFYKGVL